MSANPSAPEPASPPGRSRGRASLLLALIIGLLLLTSMVTVQVNFHEAAVITTFGAADENSVRDGRTGNAGLVGNLMLRWPWPVQKVRVYDTRVRVLEDRLEEQQTRDKQGVIVKTYVNWRIDQPLDFFRSLVTPQEAENQIRSLMRDARSVIGNYAMNDLVNSDPSKLKLAQVEATLLAKLRGHVTAQSQGSDGLSWGIVFESVGIKRILLPESVTTKVFERMRASRERLAQQARSEGDAEAASILARANSVSDTIAAFARRRAEALRAEGDAEAAKYYKVFAEDEDFAIFRRTIDTYPQLFSEGTTLFMDANDSLLLKEFMPKEEQKD